jgi:TRAP-type C4-dicarboxylate transport system permease small subunit
MRVVRKVLGCMESICVILCVILFITITFAAFMQVFTRFILGSAWKWTDEACRFCLVWLAMMGAALGVKRHAHIAIDFLIKKTPAVVQKVMGWLCYLSTAAFGVVLVRYGFSLCNTVMQQQSSVMHIPMGIVYMAVPVLGIFLTMFSIGDFLETLFPASAVQEVK